MNLLPVVLLFLFFMIGVPVGLAMVLCLIPYFAMDPYISASVIVQRMIANVETPSMMAAPFFIIAGTFMECSGATSRLFDLADCLVGHWTGGLGHVNILLSTLMGGISGSGAADAASDCKILVPEMVKRGYGKAYSGAVTAASAVITPTIPPGIAMVVFAVICEVSVGRLFAAGWVPGIMLCVGMMVVNHLIAKKRGFQKTRTHVASKKEILKALKDASWALVIPFGLILALRFGVCTAVEGGALIAFYSLIIGKFVYKELDFKQVPKIMLEAVLSVGPVMLLLCGANAFSFYMSWERIPQAITSLLANIASSKFTFLLLSNLLLLFLGMFIDNLAAMMIVTPLLAPVAASLGINLVHFGIVMCLNCGIGAITPPFGGYLFLVSGAIKAKTTDIIKEIMPFLLVCLGVLFLITFVPDVVLIVPRLIYGSV